MPLSSRRALGGPLLPLLAPLLTRTNRPRWVPLLTLAREAGLPVGATRRSPANVNGARCASRADVPAWGHAQRGPRQDSGAARRAALDLKEGTLKNETTDKRGCSG